MADIFGISDWKSFEKCSEKFYAARDKASDYIVADTGGYPDKMTKEQLNADLAIGEMESAFCELKDLMYYALKCDPDSTYALTGAIRALSSEAQIAKDGQEHADGQAAAGA